MKNREEFQNDLFMPESKWVPPSGLPEYLLRSNEPIAIDTETKDPHLKKRGPSWRYREGMIVGLCLATSDRQWYFPLAHLGGGNLPKKPIYDFFRDLLKIPRKVYLANGSYDLGWLYYEKILGDDIGTWPQFEDIILNESLLCEEHPSGYTLDAISSRRLNRTKDEDLLDRAASITQLESKKDLWKFPAKYVGPYGETDARNTFDCAIEQRKELETEGLLRVWELEQALMPLLHLVTRQGIPIDLEKAQQLNDEILVQEQALRRETGVDPWSDEEKEVLMKAGFHLPKTEKGGYSCDKKVLKSLADFENGVPLNLPAKMMKLRELNRLRSVYIEDAMTWAIRGRIHPEFLQLATDEGGARSGRMASKNPNFQQIPSRTELGKRIRGLYHAGKAQWGKFDYSSQEPRWQVHYGIRCGYDGAEAVGEAFQKGIKLYTFMEENVPGLSYNDAKMFVLARSYGMGVASLAEALEMSRDETENLLARFDKAAPYIGQLAGHTTSVANKKGYLKTILGRKRRFLYWECPDSKATNPVFGYKAAKKRWKDKRLRRAYTHKAFNALIQGSSADQTKKAMLDIWRELKLVPFCQVHDELDYPITEDFQIPKIKELMETTIPDTLCPFKVDCDIGKTWQ